MSSPPKPSARPTRTSPWRLSALLACALLTSSCVTIGRPSVRDAAIADPPQLTLPKRATEPCKLPLLPANADQAILDTVFNLRGVAILECDGKRELSNQTLEEEHRREAEWRAAREKRRSRMCRWFRIGCT